MHKLNLYSIAELQKGMVLLKNYAVCRKCDEQGLVFARCTVAQYTSGSFCNPLLNQ